MFYEWLRGGNLIFCFNSNIVKFKNLAYIFIHMYQERFYDTEGSKLRDSVFNNGDQSADWFNDLFFQKVYDLSPEGARILDIGTGNGFFLRELLKRFPSRNHDFKQILFIRGIELQDNL